ncbi:MAG: LysR family transcriptional regulator [Chitinivibrionales bacterium]|nr:LysR family transcriptional regulator [Chitinivibrionales bacterium]
MIDGKKYAVNDQPQAQLHPKIRLYCNAGSSEGVFGSGKWHLLAAIADHGSLRKAAESLKRSYRKAWGDIKVAENGLGRKLVERTRGGSNGGTMVLTSFGKAMLDAWNRYFLDVEECSKKCFDKYIATIVKKGVPDE